MLWLVGVDHTRAPVALRERLSLGPAGTREWLALARLHGLEEGVLLSTCNRSEAYMVADEAVWPVLRAWLVADWSRRAGLRADALEQNLREASGAAAVRHLFRVASGLEAVLVGESEILAQVKEAYAIARAGGSAGARVHALFQAALGAGRRVRRETDLGRESVAPGAAAVLLASESLGDLNGLSAWVWGSGAIGRPLVGHLTGAGASVTVTSRTEAHARGAAAALAQVRPWSERRLALTEADILVTAVSGAGTWLEAADVAEAMDVRRGRRLFIFDFGVPRNTDPALADVPGVVRLGVDDLQAVVERGRSQRERAARAAGRIVDEAVESFVRGHQERRAAPLIRSLYAKAETMRAEEVEWALRRMPELSEAGRARIEQLSRRLVRRLLNDPALALRNGAGGEDASTLLAAAASLFGLDSENDRADRG